MSDWKKEAATRRDLRNTRAPEYDEPAPHGGVSAKKDTKRWCRGKVGREHKLECRDYSSIKGAVPVPGAWVRYAGWKVLICTECGKELDHYYPNSRNAPPEWAR